jgi:competence protein ComEC
MGDAARRPARLDIGEDVVSPYLWSRSIRRIDLLILSHTHEDHMGGVPALMKNFKIPEIWTGATPPSPPWDVLRAEARRAGVKIVALRRGDERAYGGVRLKVLAPPAEYASESPHNNDSLVLRMAYGRHSFLLTGDIERQSEGDVLESGGLEQTHVLKVAHHGSRTSSSDRFLDEVRPAFAVVSAGLDNSYGNPHPAVLKRMRERHTVLLRTDLWGLISIRTDGSRFRMETARWSDYATGPDAALDRFF